MKVRLEMAPTPLKVVVRLGRTWTLASGTGAISCVWSRKLRIRPRRLRLMDRTVGRALPGRDAGRNNGRSIYP
ncbi:MAG: hypothetical protein ABIK45_03070 [Pseudomonadota bacterium]